MSGITKKERTRRKISAALNKLTPEAIQKLEYVYALDASIDEIAFYVGVSAQTLYNWKARDPKLFERLDLLKANPVFKARQTVVDKLSTNYGTAMDYLSRKRKIEFSPRQELTGADGKDLTLTSEERKEIDDAISENIGFSK